MVTFVTCFGVLRRIPYKYIKKSSYVILVLHTATISDVKSVTFDPSVKLGFSVRFVGSLVTSCILLGSAMSNVSCL